MRPLKDIEADRAAATPGWRRYHDSHMIIGVVGPEHDDYDRHHGGEVEVARPFYERDVVFTVAAYTDVPEMAAEIRRLRGLLADALPFLGYEADGHQGVKAIQDITDRVEAELRGEP